jgi:hypothetical protein
VEGIGGGDEKEKGKKIWKKRKRTSLEKEEEKKLEKE